MFDESAIKILEKANITLGDDARFSLSDIDDKCGDVYNSVMKDGIIDSYTQKEMDNWADSNSIVIYKNPAQVESFIKGSIDGDNDGQKLYFGKIGSEVAMRVENETGVNIVGFNLALAAYEVKKIIADHGSESTEKPRGQRAITYEDVLNIPLIVAEADKIELHGVYRGRPVIRFTKEINGRVSIVTYQSAKSHDLRVQTMYSVQTKTAYPM